MNDAEATWQSKTDAEVLVAAEHLDDYTEEGRRVILSEAERRRLDIAAVIEAAADKAGATSSPEPSGLSGWLILVGIGLVAAPLRLAGLVVAKYVPIFRDGTWEMLTAPGSDAYHWLLAPLLVFELAGNVVLILAFLALFVLFVRKAPLFPRLYITVLLTNIGFIVLDAWLGSIVFPEDPVFDPGTFQELVRAFGGSAIWIPYMKVSKRVKNTFVQPVVAEEAAVFD